MIEFATATREPATRSGVTAPMNGETLGTGEAPTTGNLGAADAESAEAGSAVPLERLGDEIAELAAHLHAATYRLLVRLAEFDRREGWSGGFRSCAHWLSWRTGIGPGAAREKVRVARALERLPLLSAAMARGELSYAKVRAATRVATPENEGELLELARHGTASHMERVIRAWRRLDRLEERREERERHESRHLSLRVEEDGSYVIRGRLAPEVGALLERALEAAGVALWSDRSRGAAEDEPIERPTPAQRRADAIGLVAEWALGGAEHVAPRADREAAGDGGAAGGREAEGDREVAGDGGAGEGPAARPLASSAGSRRRSRQPSPAVGRADRFQVVVHVDVEALREGSGSGKAVLEDGPRVSAETSRRLACDASRVVMTHDPDGAVLDVGRRTRTVPPAIRRALDHRDRGCRFPGCGLRFCDAHHIVHWADGGATRLDNLVLLCRRHHRAVHEEGFRVRCGPDGAILFERPDGRPFPEVPPAPVLPDDTAEALVRAHRAQGLGIDAWTPTPDWHGERLDLALALGALRRSGRGRGREDA